MAISGRVLQVNVSAGGVPKLPVAEAFVGRLGLTGDGHNEPTVHGGPHRAVCLYAIEAIERLQSEGHPMEPGSVGENLTTTGVEWSLLPIGTRARIGESLLLEVADTAGPCKTQTHNFSDGKFSRISIDLHPSDARMYARVLAEGVVRPGDAIELIPPSENGQALVELALDRLDWALGKSALHGWREAKEEGLDIHIVADGELIMAASPAEPGARYNQALGLARLPNLVGVAQQFFASNRVAGWIVADTQLWPDAVADPPLDMFGASPDEMAEVQPPAGVVIGIDPAYDERHVVRLSARAGEEEVGRAWLYAYRDTGWMRGAYVEPEWRGKGIQRALNFARARLAAERGCTLVGATAQPGTVSNENMYRSGMRRLANRSQYRYVPDGVAAPTE